MLRGYSKKNRKLRRKRRSTKRFGFSPEAHRRLARDTATEFRSMVGEVKRNLFNHECHRAFTKLHILTRLEGEFAADRRAYSRASSPRTGGMSKRLSPVINRFVMMCVKK